MARIIIADDDEIVAELVCNAFVDAGHGIGWLPDGRRALDLVRRRPPDLLILDCNMPGTSGIEVLRELRTSPQYCALPVLMLTGRISDADERIVRYEGANDFIRKPFHAGVLIGRAEAILRGACRW